MNQGIVTVVSHDLTVPGNHKVTVSDFLTISEGHAVVARMDAEFDFSTIPRRVARIGHQQPAVKSRPPLGVVTARAATCPRPARPD
jgi:hypothetical protein